MLRLLQLVVVSLVVMRDHIDMTRWIRNTTMTAGDRVDGIGESGVFVTLNQWYRSSTWHYGRS
jgi:purine nucleoside phosphorylase